MFDEFRNRIPTDEPDLKIGPFLLWVSGYTYINQKSQGDFAYLRTPTLLVSDNIVAFSELSDTPIFDFKKLLSDLLSMYENITIKQVIEFASNESEFRLKLTNNDLGQIRIDIEYYSWLQNGSLEFEEHIDQSYLPKIINDLKVILAKDHKVFAL
jgi:hypothetical protein